jgi:protease II
MKVKIPDELLYKNKAEDTKLELNHEQSFSLMPMKREGMEDLSLEVKEMKTEDKRITALKNRTTPSHHFFSRQINLRDYNLTLTTNENRLIEAPVIEKSLFYEHFQEKSIKDFSVFQHYVMAKTKESAIPQLLIKNLLRDTQHQVYLPEEPLDLTIEANMNYNSDVGMVSTSHVSHPEVYHEYNMAVQKLVSRPLVSYENMNTRNYVSEKITVRAGDGTDINVRLIYHKGYFSESSPAILCTDGGKTEVSSFAFKPWISAVLEKGCTLVYPEIRGTLVSDYDWYVKGILSNKMKHFTDFGRVANYLKEQKIAKKLSALGNGISGSLTVSTVMLNEPTLFESVVLKVIFYFNSRTACLI